MMKYKHKKPFVASYDLTEEDMELASGNEAWNSLLFWEIVWYFKSRKAVAEIPIVPEKIVDVFLHLENIENLIDNKLQAKMEQQIDFKKKYLEAKITSDDIEMMSREDNVVRNLGKLNKWFLLLEPFCRHLRSAERISYTMGEPLQV